MATVQVIRDKSAQEIRNKSNRNVVVCTGKKKDMEGNLTEMKVVMEK